MRIERFSSEPEMISAFLMAEINSDRFGPQLQTLIKKYGIASSLILEPKLENSQDNLLRQKLLVELRGYKLDRDLFEGFPQEIVWHTASLSPDEAVNVKYINYDYWVELSGGTRIVKDAATNIKEGVVIFGEKNDRFYAVARELKMGSLLPPPILLSTDTIATPVILEGHVRFTAYALYPELIPDELTVILGISPNVKQWPLY